MPVDSRSRSGGQGVPGALDRGAVLDQALDAAERGRPLPQLDPRRGARSPPPRRRAPGSTACSRSRPPSAAPRRRGRDAAAGRDRAPARPADGPTRRSASAMAPTRLARRRAGAACACRASAGRPRTGPRIAPCTVRMRGDARPRTRRAARAASAPATTSEWPFSTLVAACMTMSAPSVERPGVDRRGAGGIDREPRAGRMRDLGRRGDVGDRPERVRRASRSRRASCRPAAPPRAAASRSSVSTKSTCRPQRVASVSEPVAQRPVHHLGRDHVVAGLRAPGTRRSPPPCRSRTAARRPAPPPAWRSRASASRTVALSGRP